MNEETIPLAGRNLGDVLRDAAIIGTILAGVHAAGNSTGEPAQTDSPISIRNPSKSYAEAILADRQRTERLR